MMKPKAESEHDDGMLEYLEDIIGTSRFKEPIEACCKAVEELNEARGEKVSSAYVLMLALVEQCTLLSFFFISFCHCTNSCDVFHK